MASVLEPVAFNATAFRTELEEFDEFLRSNPTLGERDQLLPFFKQRKHLAAYISTLYLKIAVATEVCFEFDIMGNFRTDVLIGSRAANQFCIVEFEPGEEDAIFKKQNRKNPEWSGRFEHAFSQIVDWFWALEDERNTNDFRTTFGDGEIRFVSLLVMGRSRSLDEAKKRRMAWRTNKVLIDSKTVACITFDQLHEGLRLNFEFYESVAKVERAATSPGLTPAPSKKPKRK